MGTIQAHPSDSARPLANFTRARRRHAVNVIRRSGVMNETSQGAQLMYAVGLLICNEAGVLKKADLDEALHDESILQAARELLRKAAA